MAAIKAIQAEFPEVRNKGCHFHLSQNIYHKVQEFGLTVQYRTDENFSILICHIPALAFLPYGQCWYLDRTVWDSLRPWTKRCNVLEHLGHIYNIYIVYSKLNLKIKN